MLDLALQIAYKAHEGQCRRESCIPYIVHPIRVSYCFNDDFRKTVAVLHDIIEDTDTTLEDLRIYFPEKIVGIVDCLSRKKEEQYFDYIKKVAKHEITTEIKIADIIDNLSDTLTVQPKSIIDRYNKSLRILLRVHTI